MNTLGFTQGRETFFLRVFVGPTALVHTNNATQFFTIGVSSVSMFVLLLSALPAEHTVHKLSVKCNTWRGSFLDHRRLKEIEGRSLYGSGWSLIGELAHLDTFYSVEPLVFKLLSLQ